MFGLKRRKPPADPGAPDPAQFVVPVDLNAAHSFVAPGPSKYSSPPTYGANPYAPRLGVDLPTIKDQDAILIHHTSPPPAQNPAAYYADRNHDKVTASARDEMFQTRDWQIHTDRQRAEDNPWQHTPLSTRPTSTQSPSDWRFVRPFDQRYERNFTGVGAGSMATLGKSYPIGGMSAVPSLRNTLRIAPPSRDAENYDLAAVQTASATPAVYVSPQAPIERRW